MKSFVTLLAVIVIGTVGAGVASSLIFLSTGNIKVIGHVVESQRAKNYADACAEKALNSIKLDTNYQGNETISFTDGKCYVMPIINAGSQNPTIRVEGDSVDVKRKIEISLEQTNPQIKVGRWEEVPDF